MPYSSMRTTLAALAMAVGLAGCQTQEVPDEPERPPEATALGLVAEGRIAEAADEYAALSRGAGGAVAQDLMLKAVALLLGIGRTDQASTLMDELAGQTFSGEIAPRHALLAADIALQQGVPDRTIELLSGVPAGRFGPRSTNKFHLLLARAYEDTGRFIEAARERIALDATLVDDTRRATNHNALWDALTRADPGRREEELPHATGTFIGWLRLAAIVEEHRSSPVALERALTRWQTTFSSHPANGEIVAAMLGAVRESVRQPTRIALLLPLHGDFTEAANAIRDGFLAAWYADAANALRPAVEIHDTSFEAIDVVYTRAVEAGADFVVGPLRRDPVTAIACGDSALVTTLALNETDRIASSSGEHARSCDPEQAVRKLYHFTLAPEAEAHQIAEHAWIGGFAKAVAFTREGDWGERVYHAFAGEWERLGGILVDHRALPPDSTAVGEPIAGALGVSRSRERARDVSRMIGRGVEHEPRRRRDIDFVFIAAFPADARQFMPQLAYHHGGDLPVYATSHVWSGTPDPTNDRDLDGVVFGDMPWLIAPSESGRLLRGQLEDALAGRELRLPRLYAFGADAYRLATGLRRITGSPLESLEGHTGRLSVGANHRIVRRLAWTRFADGVPAPDEPDGTGIEPSESSSTE